MLFAFQRSPRCGAKTRNGTPCKSPAVKGKKRCRMHGGARNSGAPKRNKNALKHGYTTNLMKIKKQSINALLSDCKNFLKNKSNH